MTEPVPEAALASTLGVTRDTLRGIRLQQMKRGEHWSHQDRTVVILPAGVDLLKSHLEKTAQEASEVLDPAGDTDEVEVAALAAAQEASGEKTAAVDLYFVKAWANPCWVEASTKKTAGGMKCRVRIRKGTSDRYIRGMVMPCRHLGDDRYECTRIPKERGRW